MPKFIARQSCEYSLLLETVDEKEALKEAAEHHYSEWDKAWSGIEVEAENSAEPEQKS